MSEENVAIVRELFAQFDSREQERAFQRYDADVELDSTGMRGVLPDEIVGVYRGHDGIRTYWREWLSGWSDLEFELEDVIDGGEEIVALVANQRQWGRHSGIETELAPYAIVFSFRGGKVIRVHSYADRQAALAAAGLKG
jgi:ketosteroid isomerase-like protein